MFLRICSLGLNMFTFVQKVPPPVFKVLLHLTLKLFAGQLLPDKASDANTTGWTCLFLCTVVLLADPVVCNNEFS